MVRTFPTSEELYKRIKTDPNISSCHVSIVYFDSVLNKYIDKRFAAWNDIDKGGDIPWHRVYFFKYKDKIIWDRQKKECLIDEIVSDSINNLEESFRIVTYNILNDNVDSINDRKGEIINYILSTDADIICLQEVSDPIIDDLRNLVQSSLREDPLDRSAILAEYEMAVTDLKTNNVVFLSKHTIKHVSIINLNNPSKQALKIVVSDHNDIDIQFIGVHLTSDHQAKAEDKRKEQLAIINSPKTIDSNYPSFIIGDFNIETDSIPNLSLDDKFLDAAIILNDRTYTYNPLTNELARINCKTPTSKRYDRICFNGNFDALEYRVRTDVMASDHFPVECTMKSSNNVKAIGEHRKTSMMIIIHNDQIDNMRRQRGKYDHGYDKYMAHLNIYYGFIQRDEFDMAFYKIRDTICKKYLGLKLVFDKLDVLELDKHKVLCLLPSDETKKILMDLRNEIDHLLGFQMTPFTPHISLAKFDSSVDYPSKPMYHEMTFDQLHFSEYNDEGYVEPIMVIKKDSFHYSKKEIVRILERTLNQKIIVGGSSIFDIDSDDDDNDASDISVSDLDLVICGSIDQMEFYKESKRKLAFSGFFFDIELVTNQYSNYLKMRFINDRVHIDLHYCINIKDSDIITASRYVYDLIKNINRLDDFKKSLIIIKGKFKALGIYGQTFGYLNGINILIMLGYLYKSHADVTFTNVVDRFCKLYAKWKYPEPITLSESIKTDKSKASTMMMIPNAVPPYDNTVRNITQSTFQATIDALSNGLKQNSLPHELFIGIKCNVLYKFNAMQKFIESNIINIILSYEEINCPVRPVAKWNNKVTPANSYLYEGYITMGLNSSALCSKLSQLEISIAHMYPDQIFRYKLVTTV